MHPEKEIAAEFWQYVNERGHGSLSDSEDPLGYPCPPTLMAELERQYWVAKQLGDQETLARYLVPYRGSGAEYKLEPWSHLSPVDDDEFYSLPPTGFATIQEALYDYLLAYVGGPLVNYDYKVWLRAVAVILADTARNPNRLTIQVQQLCERGYADQLIDNTMVISDDWSVLRRKTFDFAVRNYKRNEHN